MVPIQNLPCDIGVSMISSFPIGVLFLILQFDLTSLFKR